MICKRCHASMGCTRRDEGRLSVQAWFDCPVCGRVELVSRPVAPADCAPVGTRWLAHPGWAATRVVPAAS